MTPSEQSRGARDMRGRRMFVPRINSEDEGRHPRMIQEVRDMEIRGKQSNDVIEALIVSRHVTIARTSISTNLHFARGGVLELSSSTVCFIYFIHSLLLHSFCSVNITILYLHIVLINYLISTLHNILFMFGFALLTVSTSTTS